MHNEWDEIELFVTTVLKWWLCIIFLTYFIFIPGLNVIPIMALIIYFPIVAIEIGLKNRRFSLRAAILSVEIAKETKRNSLIMGLKSKL